MEDECKLMGKLSQQRSVLIKGKGTGKRGFV